MHFRLVNKTMPASGMVSTLYSINIGKNASTHHSIAHLVGDKLPNPITAHNHELVLHSQRVSSDLRGGHHTHILDRKIA